MSNICSGLSITEASKREVEQLEFCFGQMKTSKPFMHKCSVT